MCTTEVRRSGTFGLVCYNEIYVTASQFSMELMLFRCGLSVIVRNSEVYVISRVVVYRGLLYIEVQPAVV